MPPVFRSTYSWLCYVTWHAEVCAPDRAGEQSPGSCNENGGRIIPTTTRGGQRGSCEDLILRIACQEREVVNKI